MSSIEIQEEIQDILEPLERRINECISSIDKMKDLSSSEDLDRFDVITIMLKNAKELLRESSERTNISYLASELREVFSVLFGDKNKKYKIENIINIIELESSTQEIQDTIIQQVKNLNLEEIIEITNKKITCRGVLKEKDMLQLKFINGGKTYDKLITKVDQFFERYSSFKRLHIISNLQYWGPIYGIEDEKFRSIAGDIKSSYSTLSSYVHINKENQNISNLLSKYNQDSHWNTTQEDLKNLELLEKTQKEITQTLAVFQNFTLLPSEKYNTIDELTKE